MYIAWLTWAALREENPVIIYISLLDLRCVDGLCLHINLSLLLAITKYQTCQSANHNGCKAESEYRIVTAVLNVWRPAEVQKVPCWKCPECSEMNWEQIAIMSIGNSMVAMNGAINYNVTVVILVHAKQTPQIPIYGLTPAQKRVWCVESIVECIEHTRVKLMK